MVTFSPELTGEGPVLRMFWRKPNNAGQWKYLLLLGKSLTKKKRRAEIRPRKSSKIKDMKGSLTLFGPLSEGREKRATKECGKWEKKKINDAWGGTDPGSPSTLGGGNIEE